MFSLTPSAGATFISRKPRFQLTEHEPILQSLRGVAALFVAIGHSGLVFSSWSASYGRFQGAIFQQEAAVIFFYVLSGFVLSDSIRRSNKLTFPRFMVKRFARLLPAAYLSIAFAVAVAFVLRHPPFETASDWYNDAFLNMDLSLSTIINNCLFFSHSLNGVLWSIQVELVAMFYLMPMVALIDRLSLRLNVLVLILVCFIAHRYLLPLAIQHKYVVFAYSYCFYIGAVLPYLIATRVGRALGSMGFVVATELICEYFLRLWNLEGHIFTNTKYLADALISAHIIAYVLLAPASRAARALAIKPLVWLGDISYSFYAFDQAVLSFVAFLLLCALPPQFLSSLGAQAMATMMALSGSLAIALLLGVFSYRFAERPGIRLGQLILNRYDSRERNRVTMNA
jgi:peptidoglycan/LPS O-acetylase OafA/YrhL